MAPWGTAAYSTRRLAICWQRSSRWPASATSRTRCAMPKRPAPTIDGIIGERFAVTCGKPGDYYLADPAAPLKHGCRVVVHVTPGRWNTQATLRTKHPTRAKTLSVEMKGGHIESGVERSRVASVVGHFVAV